MCWWATTLTDLLRVNVGVVVNKHEMVLGGEMGLTYKDTLYLALPFRGEGGEILPLPFAMVSVGTHANLPCWGNPFCSSSGGGGPTVKCDDCGAELHKACVGIDLDGCGCSVLPDLIQK